MSEHTRGARWRVVALLVAGASAASAAGALAVDGWAERRRPAPAPAATRPTDPPPGIQANGRTPDLMGTERRADLDGDGRDDVVDLLMWRHEEGTYWLGLRAALTREGAKSYWLPGMPEVMGDARLSGVLDLDGDRREELVVSMISQQGRAYHVYTLVDGEITFASADVGLRAADWMGGIDRWSCAGGRVRTAMLRWRDAGGALVSVRDYRLRAGRFVPDGKERVSRLAVGRQRPQEWLQQVDCPGVEAPPRSSLR